MCVFCPPSPLQSDGRPAAYGQGLCLSAAGVGTAAFRTKQPIQTVFQALHLISRVRAAAHQGTGQSIRSTLQKPPGETSSSHGNLSHSLGLPGWTERTAPEDPHPASLQFRGQQGSTELSLELCCRNSLRCFPERLMSVLEPAHLLAEGTVLREGSSAAARLKEHLPESWHCHSGTGLPRAASPAPKQG